MLSTAGHCDQSRAAIIPSSHQNTPSKSAKNRKFPLGQHLNARKRRGISLHDVALIGVDDLKFATFLDPALTMVAQPTIQFARMAKEQLLRRIDGDRDGPVHVALSGELILRGSCGCNKKCA